MKKGSKEAKAWGAKMKRARNAKNGRKKTKRKMTTRKRRTTRKGDLTLKRKPAYKTRRKKSSDKDFENW